MQTTSQVNIGCAHLPDDVVLIAGHAYSRRSYQLSNIDNDEAKYLQQHPLLNGPSREMNRRLRRKVGDIHNWNSHVSATPAERIDCRQFDLKSIAANEVGRVLTIAAPLDEIAHHLWKLTIVRDALAQSNARILCFGAGVGLECRIASVLNPTATVVGTDFDATANIYHSKIEEIPHTRLAEALGANSFDIVYSCHTLEHIYNDVELVLSNVFQVLKPGGMFVSALPCEANPTNPVINRLAELIQKNSAFSYLDIDPGHPWKTDVFDIYDKLTAAGFKDARFYHLQGSYLDNTNAVARFINSSAQISAQDITKADADRTAFRADDRNVSVPPFFRVLKMLRHGLLNPTPFELAVKLHYRRAAVRHRKNPLVQEVTFVCSKPTDNPA